MREPYISLVVAARHDDHGGNFMRRLQIFLDAFVAQCTRFRLPAELIIVEWNPLPDRSRLAEALRWPVDMSWCTARIVEVPNHIHRRFTHSDALPLYQMIAKNVGIRRARGEYILATNVDILLNDELMEFLAARKLQEQKMYRIDRYDADANVPLDAPVDQQLEYCRTHLLRINRREGTFHLNGTGLPRQDNELVAPCSTEIVCGRGWFATETFGNMTFRWVNTGAELIVGNPPDANSALLLDLEPGPGVRFEPFVLRIRSGEGAVISEHLIANRQDLRLPSRAVPGSSAQLWLEVVGGGYRLSSDPRILNFRVFNIRWSSRKTSLSRFFSRLYQLYRWHLAAAARSVQNRFVRFFGMPDPLAYLDPEVPRSTLMPQGALLHLNGCGDFTLMHRSHWMDLRGYPEFDCFSMNIDSVLCLAAHHAGFSEHFLDDPMRIYHIEHGTGSGWTPDGEKVLYERIRTKGIPWLGSSLVFRWGDEMREFNSPLIFNLDSWGMRDESLKETVIRNPSPETSAGAGDSV